MKGNEKEIRYLKKTVFYFNDRITFACGDSIERFEMIKSIVEKSDFKNNMELYLKNMDIDFNENKCKFRLIMDFLYLEIAKSYQANKSRIEIEMTFVSFDRISYLAFLKSNIKISGIIFEKYFETFVDFAEYGKTCDYVDKRDACEHSSKISIGAIDAFNHYDRSNYLIYRTFFTERIEFFLNHKFTNSNYEFTRLIFKKIFDNMTISINYKVKYLEYFGNRFFEKINKKNTNFVYDEKEFQVKDFSFVLKNLSNQQYVQYTCSIHKNYMSEEFSSISSLFNYVECLNEEDTIRYYNIIVKSGENLYDELKTYFKKLQFTESIIVINDKNETINFFFVFGKKSENVKKEIEQTVGEIINRLYSCNKFLLELKRVDNWMDLNKPVK